MGYDFHITRRKDWSSQGSDITAQEWLAYVENDPELSLAKQNGDYFVRWSGSSRNAEPWLDWYKGNIYTKNPDEALIDKMVAIAAALDAQVQGDDGEIYRSGQETPFYRRPSLWNRFLNSLRTSRSSRPMALKHPTFKVGDRMLDAWQRECTVLEIDSQAEHGLGKVVVRYDNNKVITYALVDEPLHRANKKD